MFDRNRTRLQLEPLEGRDNPAMLWDPLGTDLSSGNPLNWVKSTSSGVVRCTTADTPTSPLEDLIFGAWIPTTYIYQYGQQQQTVAAHQSNADCIMTQASGYTTGGVANYRGLTLLAAYTHEVDLRQSASVTALDVRSGKIKQNDQGTVGGGNAGTLTVTQSLDWTGGTINSNTVAGAFVLASTAAGSIDPGDGNTVTLGDTLTLLGNNTTEYGATLTHHTGVWELSQGTGIVVEGWAKLNLIASEVDTTSPPGSPLPAQQHKTDAKTVVIDAGGNLLIKANGEVGYYPKATTYDPAKQYEYDEGLPIKNEGGTLIVKEKTNVKVSWERSLPGISVLQDSGLTQLEAGCEISAASVKFTGGKFDVTVFPGSTQANRPEAAINGDLTITGTAVLNMPGSIYDVLTVSGDITWSGGEIKIAISTDGNSPISDLIIAGRGVAIANTPKLSLRWPSGGPGTPTTPWTVIKAMNGKITGNINLAYDMPLGTMTFIASIDATWQDKLYITRTN